MLHLKERDKGSNELIITLFLLLALAVGDPHAKVPYRLLHPRNVIGLPPDVVLRHPSTLSQDQLQLVYDNIASVKFVGKLD